MAKRFRAQDPYSTQSSWSEESNRSHESAASDPRSPASQYSYHTQQPMQYSSSQPFAQSYLSGNARHGPPQQSQQHHQRQEGGQFDKPCAADDYRPTPAPRLRLSQMDVDFVDHSTDLQPNELLVTIVFEHERRIEERVLLDTGSMDNWVAWDFCQEHTLQYENKEEEPVYFRDANSQLVSPLGTLEAEWPFRAQRRRIIFRVAKKLPTRIIFGYTLMLQCKMIKDNFTEPLVPVVSSKITADEQRRVEEGGVRVAEEAKSLGSYRAWRQEMLSKGWRWCETENKFYKMEGDKKRYPKHHFYLDPRVLGP